MSKSAISLLSVCALLSGCVLDADVGDDDLGTVESQLEGAARRPRSERIRDVAAGEGLTNGVLLAGIASVETGLSHCWSEAQWACQGPHSSFCNGPVIAGAGDGPCSARQGGLGLFQFDAGTYDQTLARDGHEILLLDGNISHAVDFVANIVRRTVAGVDSREEAIAWMNSVPVVRGNAKFTQWTMILACHYNGRCGSTQDEQAAKYGNATFGMLGEFGEAFWNDVEQPPPPPLPPLSPQKLTAGQNLDGRLEVFYVGTDNKLYHNYQVEPNGGWAGQSALGGSAQEIAVASNQDGRLELFYVGTDDKLYHNYQVLPNRGWAGQSPLGGSAQQIAVASNQDGRLELIYVGTNDVLYRNAQARPNGGWITERTLGGRAKQLTLAPNLDGRLELFYAGTNNQLYHKYQVSPNGDWSGESALGGSVGTN